MIPAPSGSHQKCLKCVKTYGKHFIDPKSSEFCPFFKFFLVQRKLPFFWPKLLPALFLKKPRYPCPFEILEETLGHAGIVLLPGFQKGRDIKPSKGKGHGAVLAKKGNLHCTRKNGQNFTPFSVNKMFSLKATLYSMQPFQG
jgi:hypothetical protein